MNARLSATTVWRRCVALEAHDYRDWKSLKDVNCHLLNELEHFFISYNEVRGKQFKMLGHRGPARARRTLEKAIKKARRGSK